MEAASTPTAGGAARERSSRGANLLHGGALIGAAALVIVPAGSARWSLDYLGVIAAMTIVSGLTLIQLSSNVDLSGSFLGIVLATVLLGGGPGAVIGVLTTTAA